MTDTFPPIVAKAVVKVMAGVKKLAKDGRNEHGKYNFTSVDAFYEAVGPLCADAGLFVLATETGREVVEHETRNGTARSLRIQYEMTLVGVDPSSGESASYGGIEREVTVVAAGPQSYASALSFVTKYFWRNLLQIPTGDADDADLQEKTDLPTGGGKSKRNTKNAEKQNNDAKLEAVDGFVGLVEKFLDTKPTAAELAEFEADQKNGAYLKRLREEYKDLDNVKKILGRIEKLYGAAKDGADDTPSK